jgi:hypothetical protein
MSFVPTSATPGGITIFRFPLVLPDAGLSSTVNENFVINPHQLTSMIATMTQAVNGDLLPPGCRPFFQLIVLVVGTAHDAIRTRGSSQARDAQWSFDALFSTVPSDLGQEHPPPPPLSSSSHDVSLIPLPGIEAQTATQVTSNLLSVDASDLGHTHPSAETSPINVGVFHTSLDPATGSFADEGVYSSPPLSQPVSTQSGDSQGATALEVSLHAVANSNIRTIYPGCISTRKYTG